MFTWIVIVMSSTENKALAKRFVQEIFNENKFDKLNEFVTPNIKWHGVAEDIEGFDNFKEWLIEDQKTFPDMQISIIDECAEENKASVMWRMKSSQKQEWNKLPASDEQWECSGAEFLHFQDGKINEAWTMFDALTPALEMGIVQPVEQPMNK